MRKTADLEKSLYGGLKMRCRHVRKRTKKHAAEDPSKISFSRVAWVAQDKTRDEQSRNVIRFQILAKRLGEVEKGTNRAQLPHAPHCEGDIISVARECRAKDFIRTYFGGEWLHNKVRD